jgi:hypothetical protein
MHEELVVSKILSGVQITHFRLIVSQLEFAEQAMQVLLNVRLGRVCGQTHLLSSMLYSKLFGHETHFLILQFQN